LDGKDDPRGRFQQKQEQDNARRKGNQPAPA
jgi:hypothetical protein